MNDASRSTKRAVEEVAAARAFYAGLGQNVGYFPALWHTFNVGHMLATDLNKICRKHGLSVAGFNLMGALRIDRAQQLRATDLSVTLQVSNGALTARIAGSSTKACWSNRPRRKIAALPRFGSRQRPPPRSKRSIRRSRRIRTLSRN